jgi:hypothetical protein
MAKYQLWVAGCGGLASIAGKCAVFELVALFRGFWSYLNCCVALGVGKFI